MIGTVYTDYNTVSMEHVSEDEDILQCKDASVN